MIMDKYKASYRYATAQQLYAEIGRLKRQLKALEEVLESKKHNMEEDSKYLGGTD